MKRLITLFAVMITAVCCLVSCSVPLKTTSSRKNGLNCAFSSKVSVTLDKLQAEGTLNRFGDGMWDVEFTSPNSLSGVKLSFGEGNVTASYKGLSFSVPQSALPVKAMMLNLIKAVDDNARLSELKGEEKDDTLEISGKLDGGEYSIIVDKDGRLVGFNMPGNNLKIVFTDMTVTGEAPTVTSPTSTDLTTTSDTTSTTEAVSTQAA